jgi:hypothetical protein
MDAMDILGGLLGGGSRGGGSASSGGGGLGGKILGELIKGAAGGMLGGGGRPAASQQRQIDPNAEAKRLEDMLNVATGRGGQRPAPQESQYQPPPPQPRYQQSPAPQAPSPRVPQPQQQRMSTNDEAIVMIRALINAAKADGRIDQQEQQKILSQVPNDQETINFLKHEFQQPLDVRDFAWSVPLGMEMQVYTMSLAGMNLDSNNEMQYLRELAHGLRLDPQLCSQVHQRYGVPDVV